MKKKRILWIAASAVIGLSACSYDLSEDCEENWERCNGDVVEICYTNAYHPAKPAQCEENKHCMEIDSTHTTTCVECAKDEHCPSVEGIKICKTDNTCIVCKKGAQKCDATNRIVLTCEDKGVWAKDGTHCDQDEECRDGGTECTTISDVTCVNNEKKCTIDGKLQTCAGNKWSTTDCGIGKTCQLNVKDCRDIPIETCIEGVKRCNDNSLQICNKTNQWEFEKNCDSMGCDESSQECRSKLAESTIKSCSSLTIETKSKLAFGEATLEADSDTLRLHAALLCGTKDQAIKDYQIMVASSAQGPGEKNLAYKADLSSLGNGRHFCVWSFNLKGEKAVACKKGKSGGFLKFEEVPKTDEVLVYNVIDFENCVITSVSSEVNVGDGICGTHIKFTKAGLTEIENETITGLSIIHSAASTVTLVIPNGIGQFSVDAKKNDANSGQLTVKAENLSKSSLLADAMERTTWTETLNLKDKVDIQITASGKIVTDNLRWTDFE